MELHQLSYQEYAARFANCAPTVFDRPDFTALNAPRMHRVAFLEGDGLGIALGQPTPEARWRSPFSAPFATVCGHGDYHSFIDALIRWANPTGIEFVCPVPIYDMQGWTDALLQRGIVTERSRNYHFPLAKFDNRRHLMTSSARNNLNRALRQGFVMEPTVDVTSIYNFIADHHRRLGYHMAMSEEQVRQTARVLPVEFFRYTLNGTTVGATIYYHSAPGIAQLINCADDLNLRKLHPMTFITEAALNYYHTRGFRYVDFGPVMLNGQINAGLDSFKRSMGLTASDKLTIEI